VRRAFVLIGLSALTLAASACSTSSSTSTPGTIASGPPGGTYTTTPARPITIGAYILSVDPKSRTITADPMAFLTGTAAKAAYKHDHPGAVEGPPNDYYISNPKKDSVELQLAPNATVRLVHVGGTDHTSPVAAPLSSLVGYPSLTTRPFQLKATNGTVNSITEIFVP